jgi:hypothetical protein
MGAMMVSTELMVSSCVIPAVLFDAAATSRYQPYLLIAHKPLLLP